MLRGTLQIKYMAFNEHLILPIGHELKGRLLQKVRKSPKWPIFKRLDFSVLFAEEHLSRTRKRIQR